MMECRSDGAWSEQRHIIPGVVEGGRIGHAVAMGNTFVVGMPVGVPGHVYIYHTETDLNLPRSVDPSGLAVTTLGQVKRMALFQNFPNPFNLETWLPYRLAKRTDVNIRIYDVRSDLTRELNLGAQKAGLYLTRQTAAYRDGKNQFSEPVSSSDHYYTSRAGAFQTTRRMLLLK